MVKTGDYKIGDFVIHNYSANQSYRGVVVKVDEDGLWLRVCATKKRTVPMETEIVFSKFSEVQPFNIASTSH